MNSYSGKGQGWVRLYGNSVKYRKGKLKRAQVGSEKEPETYSSIHVKDLRIQYSTYCIMGQ